MPVILETMSWILKNVNVGVDRLIVGYGVRFVYSEVEVCRIEPIQMCIFFCQMEKIRNGGHCKYERAKHSISS